jgi:hypothetical protein
MQISMDKNYQTQDGHKVKIYSSEGNIHNKIHGAFFDSGKWIASEWYENGKFYMNGHPSSFDLVEVKERQKIERWVNVYRDGALAVHLSKEKADINRHPNCFACVKITIDCEEGEGL